MKLRTAATEEEEEENPFSVCELAPIEHHHLHQFVLKLFCTHKSH